jgi:uncharacterized protein YcnI
MVTLRLQARLAVLLAGACAALTLAGAAFAHANVSPAVVLAKSGEVFTLAVPTERENAVTTRIELTPPQGFAIDSFAPAAGWRRQARTSGAGENAVVEHVTWSGGSVPSGEDAVFQFLASTTGAGTYSFKVRQTYSDGTVVDWSGPESSDTPAPTIEARSSLGGGGSDTLAIVAAALAVLALVVSVAVLVARTGGRPLA